MTVFFDLDGTIADLYGVENWLDYLLNENPYPYMVARPLVNMATLARMLHKVQRKGYEIGIISWLSKNGSDEYNEMVTGAKITWLKKHLPSVEWDEIHIVKYGVPKSSCGSGYLFDDEEPNRIEWGEGAFDPADIMGVLKSL